MDKRTYRGRGPKVSDAVEDKIRLLYKTLVKDNPNVKAKEVMDAVHRLLQKDGIQLRPGWPGISKIQKIITKIRKQEKERNPLDLPWSMVSLREHPIPPEALPIVMSVYKKLRSENESLRIREALWIGRLYKIVDDPDLLWDWAYLYAIDELVSEDLGRPFDSTMLDLDMIQDLNSARERMTEIRIIGVAYNYKINAQELYDACYEMGLENPTKEQIESVAKSGKFKREAQDERTHTPEE